MHPVVVDKPYKHYPPYQGRVWPWLLQQTVRRKLRIDFGIVDVECRFLERLEESLAAGHGILLSPNHCRPCDPLIVNEVCRRAGTIPLIIASWPLVTAGGAQGVLHTQAGAFDVVTEREGRLSIYA